MLKKSRISAMRLISGSKFTAEKKACPSVDPAGAQLVLKIQSRLVTSRRPAQRFSKANWWLHLYGSKGFLKTFWHVKKQKSNCCEYYLSSKKILKNAPDAAKIWKSGKKQSVKTFKKSVLNQALDIKRFNFDFKNFMFYFFYSSRSLKRINNQVDFFNSKTVEYLKVLNKDIKNLNSLIKATNIKLNSKYNKVKVYSIFKEKFSSMITKDSVINNS